MPNNQMTKQELALQGLTTGLDAPLEVREGGVAGRGVFATAPTEKGAWLCEYKTTNVYTSREDRDKAEEEYELNRDGVHCVHNIILQLNYIDVCSSFT